MNMGKKDIIAKEYMSKPLYFADAFNASIFKGKQVVKAEQLFLQEMDTAELGILLDDKAQETVQKYRDILKKSILMHDNTTVFLLLGIENQMDIHYAMPVKNMIYDALNYGQQVRKTSELHKKEKKLKGAEFLSGFAKTDKIMPVVTLTVYFGNEHWDGPKCLTDMFPENISSDILEVVNNYKLHIIVPKEIQDFSVFKTDFGKAMEFIAASDDPQAIKKIKENKRFEQVYVDTVILMNACTRSNIEIPHGEEVMNVCRGIDMMKAAERAEGRAEGRAEEQLVSAKEFVQGIDNLIINLKLSLEEACTAIGSTVQKYEELKKMLNM